MLFATKSGGAIMMPVQLDTSVLAQVGTETDDPLLRALERAIYIEEVLDIVLSDEVLNDHALGTPDAVATLLATWASGQGGR
ncbi:MAG: hypothetical protein GX440_11470 [Propionibacterium sp.]|jgi:hypothetical protein|nr:hypothetical protein [Propionibacterium sp.]